MVLPKNSNCSTIFRAQVCKTAGARAGGQSSRRIGRRYYAGGHEGAKKKSSDLPWLIGSVAVTVPSATWLWQQGPKKSDHGDDHGDGKHEEHEEHDEEEGEKESTNGADMKEGEEKEEEGKTDGDNGDGTPKDDEEPKETGEDGGSDEDVKTKGDEPPVGEAARNEPPNELTSTENKWTSGDENFKEGPDDTLHKKSQETKSIDPDADESEEDGPSDDIDKGQEGEQKGTRVSMKDKKRKSEDPRTNSMHPYMADGEKSKKGEGLVETAKLTGTVDTSRKLR